MTKCPTCGARYSASERLCPADGSVLEQEQSHEEKFIGQVLHGKYRLESFISRGGMGAVFRGTHVMLERPVAVKMIKPELVSSPEIVRRFQREARAATHLNHPNIVDVYDLGQTEDGTLYIAMELVKGQSLKDVIRADGPMAPQRIVRIISQVCDGLAVAHSKNIVHRDLKPHNIMLTHGSDGTETPKLVDFGIAKTLEIDAHTQLTADGSTIGTPHYMSPEQATGQDVDARSDLYSMGIILYEMLVGDVPFNDPSMPAVLIKHITEPPQPPSLRRPDLVIPAALEAVALRCLAKEPAARYASAAELAVALRTALPAEAPTDSAAATILRSTPSPAGEATIPIPRAVSMPPALGAAPVPPPPAVVAAATAVKADPTPGTRPTTPAVAPPPPIPPGMPVPVARAPSRTPLVLAAVIIVLVLASGALYWTMSRSAGAPESPQAADATAPAPAAAPAMSAPAAETPVVTAPPPSSPSAAIPPPAVATDAPRVADAPPPTRPSTLSAPAVSLTPPAAPPAPASATAPRRLPAPGTQPPPPTRESAVRQPPASPVPAAPSAPAPPAAPAPTAPAAALPANPTVSFQCAGPGEVCGPLRSAVQDAMEREGVSMARGTADITVTAQVSVVDERADRQFGTTFVVRTYSIELDADSPRFNESVPMPPSRTFSTDARLGAERLNENARLSAAALAERVRAFWKKRTP